MFDIEDADCPLTGGVALVVREGRVASGTVTVQPVSATRQPIVYWSHGRDAQ